MSERACDAAIVDYGMGNLFSVTQACERAGMRALVTARPEELLAAPAVILPGVGAFGDAMQTLKTLGLVEVLREVASAGQVLLGVCLGMQLLMERSDEFGRHEGLGLIEGDVLRLPDAEAGRRRLKIPQVGWNQIRPAGAWEGTVLQGLADGEYMYFVHSFYCRPADPGVWLSLTSYGPTEFCSALRKGRVFGCQFHPERSGSQGIKVYQNLARLIGCREEEAEGVEQIGSEIRPA